MNKFLLIIITAIFTFLITAAGFHFGIDNSTSDFSSESNSDISIKNTANTNIDSANQLISSSRKTIITNTVDMVSPAVVGINVTEIRVYRDPWGMDPFFRRFFGDRTFNKEIKSVGSGAIISSDGYILTNDHVAGNATKIIVTMTNGEHYDAKLIGSDEKSDIALLKIDAVNLPYIKIGNSDKNIIGEWVIALGNPFGLFEVNNQPTVTVGVISALEMNIGAVEDRYYLSMIQTDAAINGGNSGGPLVNAVGELIGMNTLIFTASGSSGNVGVGFAIPINKVMRIVDELKTYGEIDRDFWTGLRIQTVDEDIAKYYELPNTRGVIITYIAPNSPAYNAGFEVGDIILKVGKFRINNDDTMIGVLYEYRGGEDVPITVFRNNSTKTITMKLEKRK